MNLDIVIFKAIDYIYDLLQNRIGMMHKMKGIKKEKNIIYDDSNPKVCKLDTYVVPQNDHKYPVVFIIHGGGFVAGDKKYRRCLSSWFAKETGAFVVNVNHGLGPKFHFEESIKQLVSAANWVVNHADEYNLDLTKFVVTGDSAGGYYAAELCALQDSVLLQTRLNCKMKGKFTGILLNCGIYDINKALSAKVLFNLTGGVCLHFTGCKVENINSYEYLDVISPLSHITDNFPKAFVIYAKQDFFCGGQGEDFIEELNKHHVYNEVYFSTEFKDNHTFPSTWTSKAATEANSLMLDFTKRLFADKI